MKRIFLNSHTQNESLQKFRYEKNIISFSFGKNWQGFIKNLTMENFNFARKSLNNFFGEIQNKSFLDIGCGSGLFSLAALTLGAKEIISFDTDPFSVQCTDYLRNKVKKQKKWKIFNGSILDKNFISRLNKFDLVYAWGVLHHTGNMWNAIKNSLSLVKKGGLFFIAIYNKTKISKFWLKIKKIYNRSPNIGKMGINLIYFVISYILTPSIKFKNPFRILKEYKKKRGMNPFIDIKDWLGGYPYEYATFEEIKNYIASLDKNIKLIKFKKSDNTGNNEFLFRK